MGLSAPPPPPPTQPPMAPPRRSPLFLCLALLLATASATAAHPRQASASLRVRLIFAGARPLFMRATSWSPSPTFRRQLSAAAAGSSHPSSPLRHAYAVSPVLATEVQNGALDAALAAGLSGASSSEMDGVAAADRYLVALGLPPAEGGHGAVDVLVYSPRAAPGRAMFQYGYTAGAGGEVGVVGVASGARFVFIDVAARPFLFASQAQVTEGEVLMSASRSQAAYAGEMGRILGDLLTPGAVGEMGRFPPESRFVFEVMQVDASRVVGRIPESGGNSEGEYKVGASFQPDRFRGILEDLFSEPALSKAVSVDVSPLNVTEVAVSMAVSRAFRLDGLHLILDAQTLLRDLVLHHGEVQRDGSREEDVRYRSHSDSSFVLHIPLFLFSFADDSRLVHFGDREEVRAKCIGGRAVVMVENRLRRAAELHQDVTAYAVKEVLELLCGIGSRVLGLVDLTRSSLPPLVKDIARRNVLERQLAWSMRTAVEPADAAMLSEEVDGAPAVDAGSLVGKSLDTTRLLMAATLDKWKSATAALDGGEIEDISLRLRTSVEELRERKHDLLCSRSLREAVELNLEQHVRFWHWWLRGVIPAYLGILTALGIFYFRRRAHRHRVQLGISPLTPAGSAGSVRPSTTFTDIWFSTLRPRQAQARSKLS